MAVGSIVHPQAGTLSFLVMSTPTGWPIDQFNFEEEELRSPGVDGRRWRSVSVQHAEISMRTIADATTYAACIALARKYRTCQSGDPVTVTVAIAGTTYRFRNVHIIGVSPGVDAGGVFGSGATAGSTAHVSCQWQMILMDPALTGETG